MSSGKWLFNDPMFDKPGEWSGVFRDLSGIAHPKTAAESYVAEVDDYYVLEDFDRHGAGREILIKSPDGCVTKAHIKPTRNVRWTVRLVEEN